MKRLIIGNWFISLAGRVVPQSVIYKLESEGDDGVIQSESEGL